MFKMLHAWLLNPVPVRHRGLTVNTTGDKKEKSFEKCHHNYPRSLHVTPAQCLVVLVAYPILIFQG